MCGIAAYVGKREAAPILTRALERLEYRGYDSAGIAVFYDDKISVRRGAGKVADVASRKEFARLPGTAGIAHTRWATTGEVSDRNAHPHFSDRFAIVQNGIVENHETLRAELEGRGHIFHSETDTEVILRLLEEEMQGSTLLHALRRVFLMLRGRNAVVVLDGRTGVVAAAKTGSPLIVGVGDGELLVASDAAPVLEHTRKTVFLEDGEVAILSDSLAVYDLQTLETKNCRPTVIDWPIEDAGKNGHSHFMIKEILEQGESLRRAISGEKASIERIAARIANACDVCAIGCGTAGKVALAMPYLFSRIAGKGISSSLGSEFRQRHITDKTLLIAISQSGETADTLEAIEAVRAAGGGIISIVNVLGSTIARYSDDTILIHAGPEIAVASTKATTSQLAIACLLAHACAGRYEEGRAVLERAANAIDQWLGPQLCQRIRAVAETLRHNESMYVIGRGQNYPIALEAAIKIQEVGYLHAGGFAGGELKHGPLALISPGTPCLVFASEDDEKERTLANAAEIKARGGRVIGVAPKEENVFDVWIPVPNIPGASMILNVIPAQLLAYYLGVVRGNDVDAPRNLAKSVTVF